jgi:H+-transporting ATPase
MAVETGLTTREAQERLKQYGRNVISERQLPEIKLLLRKFWGIVPWMLEASILIDLLIRRWAEAVLIIILLLYQGLLGFYQERKAKQAVALLKQRLSVSSRVNRDGTWQNISASELVPGDLIHLQSGDIVPADIKITEGGIFADQSQLTGESLPVEAGTGKSAFAGSLVNQGEAYGIVIATGDKTYYGKTASLVRLAEKPPLMQRLALEIARVLLIWDAILAVLALAVMAISGASFALILPFILMLLVLSVPIALPAMSVLSATLATQALAERGILTARLSAIEDAAAMDILCIDKTGTLTENRPKVEKIAPLLNFSGEKVLYLAALTVEEESRDPLNLALLRAAAEKGLMNGFKKDSRVKLEHFNLKTKSSGAWIMDNNQELHVIKGEPASIAKLLNIPWTNIAEKVSLLSEGGDRVIAVASGTDSKMELIGLISLTDPLRADSAELVTALKKQGLRVLLLTGDIRKTAEAVAAKVNIVCSTAPENIDYKAISAKDIENYNVFPKIFPEDKYWIIRKLQDGGYVVGMTGDGVNDAPALRQASVGIATANAADVAKAAAGLVITRPGLSNIPEMIKISRGVHQRIKNWIIAMVTRKVSIPTFIAFGLLFFREFVISSFLAFIFMLFGDIVTFSFSKDNVTPSKKPDRWNVRQLAARGSVYASILFLMSAAVFWLARYYQGLPAAQTQSIIFVWLVLAAGQAVLYLVRARNVLWERPYPGPWFMAATVLTVTLTFIMAGSGFLMAPVSINWLVGLTLSAVLYLVAGNAIIYVLGKTELIKELEIS